MKRYSFPWQKKLNDIFAVLASYYLNKVLSCLNRGEKTMENSNSIILNKGYGLKLISCTRTRTGLVCRTDKGIKELKKVLCDERTVVFEDAVKRHLKQRGFRGVSTFIETLDGTPFFNYEDTRYVLEEHVPCKSADLTDRTILKKAVESLADIHGMTEDFLFEGDGKNGADLSQLYNKRKQELLRIIGRIKKGREINPCDRLILDNGMRFIKRAEEAMHLLDEAGYGDKREFVICHNCYKGDNVRIEEKEEYIFVSGFSKCAFDMGTVDVAEFIRRFYKDTQCRAEDAVEIIVAYCNKRQLSESDISMIYAMLLYPAKFFKLCNTYYNKRRSFVSGAVMDKFSRCCAMAEKEEVFLKTLRNMLMI